jgi:ATP citrate (pro-S)-lyase
MPITNLIEYGCKILFNKFIEKKYIGYCFNKNNSNINDLNLPEDNYVVKIDCAIKGRLKKGLLKINVNIDEVKNFINSVDYSNFIIEPYIENITIEPFTKKSNEYYISIINDDTNLIINYSQDGGIGLDKNSQIKTISIPLNKQLDNNDFFNLNINYGENHIKTFLNNLLSFYNNYHLTFLEINPFIIINNEINILDMICSIDSTALYLPQMAEVIQYIYEDKVDQQIKDLDERTGGSLKFKLLNPNGNIWLLIAGGGASVVYMDTLCSLGYKDEIANYGEYSGNPPSELVYQYCCYIFEKINNSVSNKPYYLFIGGAIANFTLVDKTFEGIIKALIEYKTVFINKNIKVLVRRGGPNYEIGLKNIKNCCDNLNIYCEINGPNISLTQIVKDNLSKKNTINSYNHNFDFNFDIPLFYKNYSNIIQPNCKMGIYGGDYQNIAQRIIDFDIISNRNEPSIGYIIDPNLVNRKLLQLYWKDNLIIMIPVYKEIPPIVDGSKINLSVKGIINFASFRSAYYSSYSCLKNNNIDWIAIIAEGMPELYAKKLSLEFPNKLILGPSTIGGIIAGNLRIGNTGGTIDNIISSNLHSNNGSVGIITKSGGLLNELCNIVNKYSSGVHSAISIGGDRYPCTNFIDIAMMYNNNPQIKLIVILGEVGGNQEIKIAHAFKNKVINKPILALCLGNSAEYFTDTNIQFGHAGAFINNDFEKASFKNEYMRHCGIIVPCDFDNISNELLKINIDKINNTNNTNNTNNIDSLKNRKKYDIISSICDERGEELKYNNTKISELEPTIGTAISNLWFKKNLPIYMQKYFEFIIFITADHGPCVSGAQNTIITTRAGKDLVSSLCSGLLTIGPKFGGAVNQAGIDFYNGWKNKYTAYDFVEYMKNKGQIISGIGHKIKSKDNPDSRVILLNNFIKDNFPSEVVLNITNFAKQVEEITLKKKNNLILNVDGFIAVSILDGLLHHFSAEHVEKLLELDIFNAFFILGRTIGFIGHHIDQKMLGTDLYRMPQERVGYIKE